MIKLDTLVVANCDKKGFCMGRVVKIHENMFDIMFKEGIKYNLLANKYNEVFPREEALKMALDGKKVVPLSGWLGYIYWDKTLAKFCYHVISNGDEGEAHGSLKPYDWILYKEEESWVPSFKIGEFFSIPFSGFGRVIEIYPHSKTYKVAFDTYSSPSIITEDQMSKV